MADWSLTSLQLKLIKMGARVVRHARAITFQLAEVAVTGPMVGAILAAIRRLRTPPSCRDAETASKRTNAARQVCLARCKTAPLGEDDAATRPNPPSFGSGSV